MTIIIGDRLRTKAGGQVVDCKVVAIKRSLFSTKYRVEWLCNIWSGSYRVRTEVQVGWRKSSQLWTK